MSLWITVGHRQECLCHIVINLVFDQVNLLTFKTHLTRVARDFQNRSNRHFIALCCVLLLKAAAIIGVILYAGIGLGPDEAQYWTWSRNLAWGYYSQTPWHRLADLAGNKIIRQHRTWCTLYGPGSGVVVEHCCVFSCLSLSAKTFYCFLGWYCNGTYSSRDLGFLFGHNRWGICLFLDVSIYSSCSRLVSTKNSELLSGRDFGSLRSAF